jgi:hypothetical protein
MISSFVEKHMAMTTNDRFQRRDYQLMDSSELYDQLYGDGRLWQRDPASAMIDTEQTQASASIRKRPWCCINHDVGLGDAMMNDTVDFTRWIFVRLSASEACR